MFTDARLFKQVLKILNNIPAHLLIYCIGSVAATFY